MLQGSGYNLPIIIEDDKGNIIDDTMVTKGVFTIGNVEKKYDGLVGDVFFDKKQGAWIVPLSEQETFGMKGNIKWQARFLFVDGLPDGTEPRYDNVIESINKTILSEG